jgi:flagella basal body P-ring formation protein FlgA
MPGGYLKPKSALVLTLFFISTTAAFAQTDASPSLSLSSLVKKALENKITKAEIQIPSLEKIEKSAAIADFDSIKTVRLIEEKSNGIATLEVVGLIGDKESSQVIQTPFEAWINVPVATHRIYPNTKLKEEDFKVQPVNVASGPAREYRGVMISSDTNFDRMESAQSILEGQYVVASAVRKQPDVRKGDMVKLELISGELTLVTQAQVQEPASVGERVRVLTTKTKKEIVGKVKEDHSVEVEL